MSAMVEHRSGPGDADADEPDAPGQNPGADEDRGATDLGTEAPGAPVVDDQVELGGGEPDDIAPAEVEQDAPAPSPAQLRVDFGAHFEANYQRLVAQLYAITLNPGEAHDVVQDAYSRAWRQWATVGRSSDPTAWVRRVAVRSTIRSWRRALARIGIGRPGPVGDGGDARTGAMLTALRRLPAAERRCVVLSHMAGADVAEIAAVEQVSMGTVQARLARARLVVTDGLAEVMGQDADGVDYDEPSGAAEQPYDGSGYDSDLYAVYDNHEEHR